MSQPTFPLSKKLGSISMLYFSPTVVHTSISTQWTWRVMKSSCSGFAAGRSLFDFRTLF
jgi:hypothetical protein